MNYNEIVKDLQVAGSKVTQKKYANIKQEGAYLFGKLTDIIESTWEGKPVFKYTFEVKKGMLGKKAGEDKEGKAIMELQPIEGEITVDGTALMNYHLNKKENHGKMFTVICFGKGDYKKGKKTYQSYKFKIVNETDGGTTDGADKSDEEGGEGTAEEN